MDNPRTAGGTAVFLGLSFTPSLFRLSISFFRLQSYVHGKHLYLDDLRL